MVQFSIKLVCDDMCMEVRRHWRALHKALLIPALAMISLDAAVAFSQEFSGFNTALYIPASTLLYALFAVSCHRIILLGETEIPSAWGLYLNKAVWRYAWIGILISLLGLAVLMPVAALLSGIVYLAVPSGEGVMTSVSLLAGLIGVLATAAFFYVFSRASLALPAAAIGLSTPIFEAWDWSKNLGWKLTWAIFWPFIVLYTAIFLLEMIDNWILDWVIHLLSYYIVAVTVALLSCAYRRLGPGNGENNAPTTALQA